MNTMAREGFLSPGYYYLCLLAVSVTGRASDFAAAAVVALASVAGSVVVVVDVAAAGISCYLC